MKNKKQGRVILIYMEGKKELTAKGPIRLLCVRNTWDTNIFSTPLHTQPPYAYLVAIVEFRTLNRFVCDQPKEDEDGIKSSCPLCPRGHTCYNEWDKGQRSSEGELTPKDMAAAGDRSSVHFSPVVSTVKAHLSFVASIHMYSYISCPSRFGRIYTRTLLHLPLPPCSFKTSNYFYTIKMKQSRWLQLVSLQTSLPPSTPIIHSRLYSQGAQALH